MPNQEQVRPSERVVKDEKGKRTIEEIIELDAEKIQEVLVESVRGRIVVEVTDGQPKIIARTIIEREDSKVKKEDESGFYALELENNGRRVVAKPRSSGISGGSVISAGRGYVVVGGNVYGSMIVTGEGVFIGGRRVTLNSYGEVGFQKRTETIILVPEKDINVILRNESGETEVKKLQGNVIASGSSGDIEVEEAFGFLKVEQNSGDLSVGKVVGELDIRVNIGNVVIDSVKGSIIIEANSGSVRIDELQVENNSRINCNSGSIQVRNVEGATIHAKARSGKIKKPKNFVVLEESTEKNGGQSQSFVYFSGDSGVMSIGGIGGEKYLTGYFGEEEPTNTLNLRANSGGITIG